MSEVLDVQVDVKQAKEKGARDFNFFSGLCLPHVVRFLFPSYYIAVWAFLVNAIESKRPEGIKLALKYVIGLPRGFAKTTFLKCLVCWLICYDKLSFILIICATDPLAEAFLEDVNNILQSENIEKIFGTWIPATDNAGTKKGAYHQRILILKARGAGTAVRGINEDNRRPELILCDDMQTKENDESESEREHLFNWFVGTLLKTVDQFFSICIYVGNMYSDHCILYLLKENHHWTSLITGAILEDETSLWPELFSIEDLYDSFLHDESLGKADIWFAEIMNDPISSQNPLLTQAIAVYALEIIPSPDASFITIDPAGFRETSDDNVITAHYLIDNKGYVAEMDGGIWDPGITCERAIAMAITHNSNLIGVESVAYQQTLQYWLQREMMRLGVAGISVVPIKRGTNKSKLSHIRAFISELNIGNYYFIRAADRARFVWQAMAYKIGKKKNKDDWLDSPSMGLTIRNEYAPLLGVRTLVQQQSARVRAGNTPF